MLVLSARCRTFGALAFVTASFGERKAQLRLADARNAHDERHAAARVARRTQPAEPLIQRGELRPAASEIRQLVAVGAEFGWQRVVGHGGNIAPCILLACESARAFLPA